MSKPFEENEAERHRTKMAKRKAVQDAEVAAKTIEKGLLIVHTGTGKGKSTAAFGLALRMLGRGHRVGVVQFIKGAWHSAERDALAVFADQVSWHTMGEGFTWETQDLKRDVAAAEQAWAKAVELMADPTFGLVILDEHDVRLSFEAGIAVEHEPRQIRLHALIGSGLCGPVNAALHHDLRADLALWLEQHGIHMHAWWRACGMRL